MSKEDILYYLKKRQGFPVSGEQMANELHLSRTAVWKSIQSLREMGYDISAKTNEGYVLHGGGGFQGVEIQSQMRTKTIGKKIIFLQEVNSTNHFAKEMAKNGEAEGTIVVAAEQTDGKGRMKRDFYSPKDCGVYFSMILRPLLSYQDINLFTLCVAMSVTEAIHRLSGRRPQIKWPNDIVFNENKVCGILSECMLEAETGNMDYLICGIGVNVLNSSFPSDIPATSIAIESGKQIDRAKLIAEICLQLEQWYDRCTLRRPAEAIIQAYQQDMILRNEPVSFVQNNEQRYGIVRGIDEHGGLLIESPDGKIAPIVSGEIKLRRAT